MNNYYQLRRRIDDKINKIPKRNKLKFHSDYLKLIELAQKDDYENFEL